MTIRHLRVFVCVAKHLSMTKAAEELFIAQPAVSNTILEMEVGMVKLLEFQDSIENFHSKHPDLCIWESSVTY